MVTNARIERKKSDIIKTEARLLEVKERLREQREDLKRLEDEEIVAMFRKEIITEDDLKNLMRSRMENESGAEDGSQSEITYPARERREE